MCIYNNTLRVETKKVRFAITGKRKDIFISCMRQFVSLKLETKTIDFLSINVL